MINAQDIWVEIKFSSRQREPKLVHPAGKKINENEKVKVSYTIKNA